MLSCANVYNNSTTVERATLPGLLYYLTTDYSSPHIICECRLGQEKRSTSLVAELEPSFDERKLTR